MLQSLLLTGLGGLIAITGTVIGQRLQAREAKNMRIEDRTREDRYRLHKERLDAYVRFHVQFGLARRPMLAYSEAADAPEALEQVSEARIAAWQAFVFVRLIGSPKAVAAARAVMWEITAVAWDEKKFEKDRWSDLVLAFRTAARRDVVGEDEALLPELDGETELQRRRREGSLPPA